TRFSRDWSSDVYSSDLEATQFDFHPQTIMLDCIFGYGLTRPIEAVWKSVITQINNSPNTVISVDMPSGLFCDRVNKQEDLIVRRSEERRVGKECRFRWT